MKVQMYRRIMQFFLIIGLLTGVSGCIPSLRVDTPATVFDLGILYLPASTSIANATDEQVIIIPEVIVSGEINSSSMVYRYTNVLVNEPRSYANSRWAQLPAEMIRFRTQQYLGVKYPVALTSELGARDSWVVRLTVEDFSQHFMNDQDSVGVVQLRATLVRGGHLVEQRLFRAQVSSAPNAPGAAAAISTATDDVLSELLAWVDSHMQSQP